MISIPDLLNQIKSIRSSIVFIVAITFGIMGLVLWGHLFYDVPFVQLTGDFASTLEVPFYLGFQSQIGVFFWSAAVTVCFYSAHMIFDAERKIFFISFGLLSVLLGLDDVFMLHESVFPALGIHQKVVVLSYGIFVGTIFLRFYKVILLTDYLLLFIALGFFAISLFIDNFILEATEYITKFAEDGAKFIGIVSWFVYLYHTGYRNVTIYSKPI